MPPTQSAVIVVVPEADLAVGEYRATLDRAAGWGVPAHVTVVYPFVPPDELGPGVLAELAAAVATVPAFEVSFGSTEWFGETVLWLAPTPAEPFRALIRAVERRFPDHPPYGGEYDNPIPHLTVGHDAPVEILRGVESATAARLPIRAHIGSVRLMVGSPEPDSWRTLADLPLGTRAGLEPGRPHGRAPAPNTQP